MSGQDAHDHDFCRLYSIDDKVQEYVGPREPFDVHGDDHKINLFPSIFLGICVKDGGSEAYSSKRMHAVERACYMPPVNMMDPRRKLAVSFKKSAR